MAIIEINGLSKTYSVYQKREGIAASIRGLFHRQYRSVHAVRQIDLQVDEGEFVAFLGPNGAGKTTTLKLLSGVIHPTEGTASAPCRIEHKGKYTSECRAPREQDTGRPVSDQTLRRH